MSLPDLYRAPDSVFALIAGASRPESLHAADAAALGWGSHAVRLDLTPVGERKLALVIQSRHPLKRVILRWRHTFDSGTRLLGDTWERAYGELEWRGFTPHRPMPWYFLAVHEEAVAGYGVQTGGASIACWRADADGVTLELDVRSGGEGVELGGRHLHAATLVQRRAQPGESPFQAARGLCRVLCPHPLMPGEPVVGHNDWYWLYGKSSETLILDGTRRLVDLYPEDAIARPWSVVDGGWQCGDDPLNYDACDGGPWDRGTAGFPDLPGLAGRIKALGARPGIWMRPLLTWTKVPASWQLAGPKPAVAHRGYTLDPSVPAVLDQVSSDVTRLRGWGFEMIKHDFSTFDISGRWGFDMSAARDGFAPDGWAFADRTRTTAEILVGFYRTIREAAGRDVTLIGCNTVGHLAAGLVEIQRIGDDTSATDWDRTRRMGVNALAFRAAQHGAFFAADADCVPVSPHVPASLTRSWLNLVARSGTPLFLSINPEACDGAMQRAMRCAVAEAARPMPVGEPLDWMDTAIPSLWRLDGDTVRVNWSEWAVAPRAETACLQA